jgi:hypothetical protein
MFLICKPPKTTSSPRLLGKEKAPDRTDGERARSRLVWANRQGRCIFGWGPQGLRATRFAVGWVRRVRVTGSSISTGVRWRVRPFRSRRPAGRCTARLHQWPWTTWGKFSFLATAAATRRPVSRARPVLPPDAACAGTNLGPTHWCCPPSRVARRIDSIALQLCRQIEKTG